MSLPVRGATVAASDVGVMSGMHFCPRAITHDRHMLENSNLV